MSDQQILEKSIQKAIDGGWNGGGRETEVTFDYDVYDGYRVHIMTYQGSNLQSFIYTADEEIIFNHDFAKALWGEKEYEPAKYVRNREYFTMPATGDEIHEVNLDRIEYDLEPGGWQYHLQQMVIAEDPIKYLGENI